MRILTLALAISSILATLNGQVAYEFDFNNCGLEEKGNDLPDIVQNGSPQCICGPRNDAFFFDDDTETMEMPLPGDLLERDQYSFSFYLRPANSGGGIQQIFSNERNCRDRDSLFSIQYFSTIRTVQVRLSDFGATVGLVEAALDVNKCWHQITLVKSGRILQLFVNGREESRFAGNLPVNVYSDEPIRIARTSCPAGSNVTNYRGGIDEIVWYDRALTPSEVAQFYLPVDEVISGDTLIFLGDQFIPRVSTSCANSIQWQPTNGLSNPSIFQPQIGPATTQNYSISFSYSGCVAMDSITVVVVDEDDVDCEEILLPTAFTPNGDNLNDEFGVSNAFIMDELLQFEIMDRQGNALFSGETPEDKWTGEYRGKIMSSGVYIYKLSYTCKNEEYSRTGTFNIIR